jgi:hypothetical protein
MNQLDPGEVNFIWEWIRWRPERLHDLVDQSEISSEQAFGVERVWKEAMTDDSTFSHHHTPQIYRIDANVDTQWSIRPNPTSTKGRRRDE